MATLEHKRLALGVTIVAVALAGCGGGSGHSFTIKADYRGDVAYLVIDSAVPQQAIGQVLLQEIRSNGAVAFVTSVKPTVALDCSRHTKIGEVGIPPGVLHPYTGDEVSIDIYGSGRFADGICSGFLSSATGG